MIEIVENTLRDGSYVIDFQFSAEQTATVVAGLSGLGLCYIEVGHGLGLGAWNNPKLGLAGASDQDYITAARRAAPTAKIGVFFIPGIGSFEDLDQAVDLGVDFIRIGINVDAYQDALPFVEYAKRKGVGFVALNLMKSYAVKSYEFTQIVRDVDSSAPVDVVYLVDSAGCMMPEEVFEYIDRTKERVRVDLGFHGHNNLSLAVANTLQAIRAGAKYVDSCVGGMGRSAGNAQTEILIPLLQKLGISPVATKVYDFYDFANRSIVPLMKRRQGLSDEEIHIGVSRFHTSYLPWVEEAVLRYGVDKRQLIKEVSAINCVNPTRELFTRVAKNLI